MITRRVAGAFALRLLALGLLACSACGGDDDSTVPPTAATATATPELPTETAPTVAPTAGALDTPATASTPAAPVTTGVAATDRVLVFSKTVGFRHDSIEAATHTIGALGAEHGFEVVATEDAATFSAEGLARFEAVVFLMTTGDVLDPVQQTAMEAFVTEGGGFVGIHAAADTEYDWRWYGELVGAYFASHPAIQPATITVADPGHPSTAALPSPWTVTDEWYNFRATPRGHVHVLLELDESSYSGGTMGADHPIAWCHDVGQGRSWYTALGHTREQWATPELRAHVAGGLLAVLGLAAGDCTP